MAHPNNTSSHYQPRSENLSNGCEETRLKCDSKSERFLNTTSRESRYDSADSGIGESTSSVTSSWDCDDTSSNSSNENGRNLTQECENEDSEHYWTISDDDQYWGIVGQQVPGYYVTNAIAKQIEYYLSDAYLMKDKYLLRQIRCKKDGYVSIKLITSFKKVKKLTRDWAVVRSAIVRLSTTVVVSSEGLRIRRRANLSENLRKPRQLTSVLAIRLPSEYNSVEKVTSLFALFGEIGFVRLLRSDKEVPCDLKNYATQVYDIGKSLCAVVDFDQSEDALASVRILK
uniref:HTH La-type RNA-binding domain-containing protein n=2 Tax=Ciona intestinalis TaxID=7719 RepID=H2XKB5_CIOIN